MFQHYQITKILINNDLADYSSLILVHNYYVTGTHIHLLLAPQTWIIRHNTISYQMFKFHLEVASK